MANLGIPGLVLLIGSAPVVLLTNIIIRWLRLGKRRGVGGEESSKLVCLPGPIPNSMVPLAYKSCLSDISITISKDREKFHSSTIGPFSGSEKSMRTVRLLFIHREQLIMPLNYLITGPHEPHP